MGTVYLVMVLGYWGKATDIKTAAQNCRKEGGQRKDPVLVRSYSSPTLTPEEVTVDNCGYVFYPAGVEDKTIHTPRTGKTKLGDLLK